mmetsp:Transcript_451/g.1149  ORF Transcript_451/g.1149 Transcript_451/m.1149 type:complete len:210 (+) Transcript_451:341-970(+)
MGQDEIGESIGRCTGGWAPSSLAHERRECVVFIADAHRATTQRAAHDLLELAPVRLQQLRRFLVQRIIGVRFEHEEREPVDDRVDGQHRLPVLAEDVETHVALHVDVRVVHRRLTQDLWRIVRVRGWHLEVKGELASPIHAVIRTHVHLELHQVVCTLVKLEVHTLAQRELRQVLLHPDLPGIRLGLALLGELRLLGLLLLQREELDHW